MAHRGLAGDHATQTERIVARQRVSRHGGAALVAMLAPAALFPLGLIALHNHPKFAWLDTPAAYPWELWLIALAGTVATLGGLMDWRFHRSGETSVGRKEHLSHVAALGLGGGTMFVLMSFASLVARPQILLLPILIVALFTATLICYDEFVFHRKRCDRYETMTHRLLVFGNTIAWLAWMHWCFVREATHG